MPNYIITITDTDIAKVHSAVESNLQEQKKVLDKVSNNKTLNYLNKIAGKVGFKLSYWIEWKWETEAVCSIELDSTASLKNKVYNDAIRKLAEHGKMRLERIKEGGNVILNEGL